MVAGAQVPATYKADLEEETSEEIKKTNDDPNKEEA